MPIRSRQLRNSTSAVARMDVHALTWLSARTKLGMPVYVILHTLLAVLGPGALVAIINPFHLFNLFALWGYSPLAFLSTQWLADIIAATLYGLVVAKVGWSKGARWAWAIPAALFFCAAAVYLVRHQLSLLDGNTGFISHFSGYDCAIGLLKIECYDYWISTLPLIRTLCYSATALLVSPSSATREAA